MQRRDAPSLALRFAGIGPPVVMEFPFIPMGPIESLSSACREHVRVMLGAYGEPMESLLWRACEVPSEPMGACREPMEILWWSLDGL